MKITFKDIYEYLKLEMGKNECRSYYYVYFLNRNHMCKTRLRLIEIGVL